MFWDPKPVLRGGLDIGQISRLQRTFAEIVPEAYHDFSDVFSKDAFNVLPPRKPWDHAIDLTPGANLPRSRTFPLSPAEQ